MRWDRLEALGWRPATTFADGLAITLAWYRDHRDWVADVLAHA
jgi:dTDP-glucose 4,6-dehydratase